MYQKADIEQKITKYYKNLIGTANRTLTSINIVALRKRPQLDDAQREALTTHITENENFACLKGIKDISAPCIDGSSAKFFKSSWNIIKQDIIKVVMDFFERKKMYKEIKCTLMTLIPKTTTTDMVKDYRHISCCTIIYKIISRIMTARPGKVLGSIIHRSQDAFFPSKNIHDHILLEYELIRGYSAKNRAPRCMLQMHMQKAYDIVKWEALEAIIKELNFPHQ